MSKKNFFKEKFSVKNSEKNGGSRNAMTCIKETVQNKAEKLKSVMNGQPKIKFIYKENFDSRRLRLLKNREKAKKIIYMENQSRLSFLNRETRCIEKSQENFTIRSSKAPVSNSGFSIKNIGKKENFGSEGQSGFFKEKIKNC